MALPKDFQFTDNPDVNALAEDRAKLMFGKDWSRRGDVLISRPSDDKIVVSSEETGRALEVDITPSSPIHRHTISCKKSGDLDDPAPNIPAVLQFFETGKPSFQAHFSGSIEANPPDGSPSQVAYWDDGSINWCRYWSNENGFSFVPTEEVAKRMAGARESAAAELCSGSPDIVALSAGVPQQLPSAKPSSAFRL